MVVSISKQEETRNNILLNCATITYHYGMWRASKKLPQVVQEASEKHGASKSMIRANASLISSKKLDEIDAIGREGREIIKSYSAPWIEGARIIFCDAIDPCEAKVAAVIERYTQAVKDWLPLFPQEREEAKGLLAGLWRLEDYPREDQIAKKFYIECELIPIPDPNDWRLTKIKSNLDDRKRRYEEFMDKHLKATTGAALGRIREEVQRLVYRLSGLDNKGNPTATGRIIIHDDLIPSIEAMLDLIPLINVCGDEKVTEFALEVREKLLCFDSDFLRESDQAQHCVKVEAQALIERIDDEYAHLGEYL